MKQRGKVLIIEDNQDWQEDLRDCLEEINFYVEIASSLEDGLEKIENGQYHFVTIDLQLDESTSIASEFEGWKILEEIIQYGIDRTMPTMVITGYDKKYQEIKEVKKLKSTFFMAKKAFDKNEFIKTVTNAVERLDVTFYNDKKKG